MNNLLLVSVFSLVVSSSTWAALQEDIDTLFNLIQTSVDDSNFYDVNQLLIRYKRVPADMKSLLTAKKEINGIADTTPLHLAAQNGNYTITAIIFNKASVVPNYPVFSRELGNALDGDGYKAIHYASTTQIYDFLTRFTDPPYQLVIVR